MRGQPRHVETCGNADGALLFTGGDAVSGSAGLTHCGDVPDQRAIGAELFDELAVMVDTFRPLSPGEAGHDSDDGVYAYSWAKGDTEANAR